MNRLTSLFESHMFLHVINPTNLTDLTSEFRETPSSGGSSVGVDHVTPPPKSRVGLYMPTGRGDAFSTTEITQMRLKSLTSCSQTRVKIVEK